MKQVFPASPKFRRREFLKASALGVASLALGSRDIFAVGKVRKPPNILWIMSDEHNLRVAGPYGNRIVRTPNIDALAAAGVTFDTHYCNSPLCVPSRASITAGKYCSRVDVWSNSCELPSADIPSLPRMLNAAGYESFLCGKQHYDYSRRYGFTEVGGNFNDSFKNGRKTPPPDRHNPGWGFRPVQRVPSGSRNPVLEHDKRVTAGTLDFLSKRQPERQAILLISGYLAPHFPLMVPEEYWERYQGRIEMPAIPDGFYDTLPLNYRLLRAGFGEIGLPDATGGADGSSIMGWWTGSTTRSARC